MDRKKIREEQAKQEAAVRTIVQNYLQTHACPCDWQPFVYYIAKEHPVLSYDPFQNLLVDVALELPIFTQSPPACPQYCLESDVTCSICGSQWLYFCEEWRMLGYRKWLSRADGMDADPGWVNVTLKGVGCDPNGRLDLEKWLLFMQM